MELFQFLVNEDGKLDGGCGNLDECSSVLLQCKERDIRHMRHGGTVG
jgi:hypothetical protein